MLTLAKIYRDGDGVPQNGKRAVELLEEIAFSADDYFRYEYEYPPSDEERGNSDFGSDRAKYELGKMYLYGLGVEKNIHRAARWFANISELECYDSGEVLKIAEAYHNGDGVEKDVEKAVAWYEWLIEYNGDFDGKISCTLGEIYFNGEGVKKDINTAVEWYERAAESGNEKAGYKLWKIERYGKN